MHVRILLILAAGSSSLRLLVLQNLEDLGLEKPKAEVVMRNKLIRRFNSTGRPI
jgi:hypothetical protein